MYEQSKQLFIEAQRIIPGGVNSPVRAFKSVGGTPLFIDHAQGAYLYDADGRCYVDYVGSWGPLILGHAHPNVVKAIQEAASKGTSYGAPHAAEIELAKLICQVVPSIENVRFVNSGTEATMTAIRLARGYTKRDKFIKFEGCYHGHADALLVKAGSGGLTFGLPNSAGVPVDVTKHTLVADYNDLCSVKKIFAEYPHDIAAIIVEPVAGNMNCILPVDGFLEGLRELCDNYGALLIFDEVITGFRVSLGGAQQCYSVMPDLTTLGKIIGGGLPVGAVGGRKEIMEYLAPQGNVYQAGTLSGNPLAMAAGIANLRELMRADFYNELESKTQQLVKAMQERAQQAKIPLTIQQIGSMFGLFFTDKPKLTSLHDVMQCNIPRFKQFFHDMLKEGIYFAPSAFEASFVSAAHSEQDIDTTLSAIEKVLSNMT